MSHSDIAQLVGYSDSFSQDSLYKGLPLYSVKSLVNADFDYIIVVTSSITVCDRVINELTALGIDDSKLLNFYGFQYDLIYGCRKEDRLLLNCNDNIDGIILGISHALHGINPIFLNGNWYNFSMPHQDLFYNLERLNYLYNNYFDKIKSIKYVIIDMYNYSYFNYDCSLSFSSKSFLRRDGYKLSNHNVDLNELYNYREKAKCDYEILMKIINTADYISFIKNNEIPPFDNKWGAISTKQTISNENVDCVWKDVKIHVKTIAENIIIFDEMLSLLNNINKDIKIYCIFLPLYRYKETPRYKAFKGLINGIFDTFKFKYNFKVFDFSVYKPFTENPNYFYDKNHINDTGAEIFTKLLNEILYKDN